MGSSLKFCLVAKGKPIFICGIYRRWSGITAAAQYIVEAAGGGVYRLDGRRLRYGKADLRNPAVMTIGDGDYDWAALIAEPRK